MVNQSATPKCPLCRAQLAAEQLKLGVTAAEAAAAAPPEEEEAAEAPAPAEPAINSESKLQALLKEVGREGCGWWVRWVFAALANLQPAPKG